MKLWRLAGRRTPLFSALTAALQRHACRTFMQAGAHDGISNDPYREFIVSSKLRGVLVEPIPSLFQLLQKNYAYVSGVTFEECAITYPSGRVQFYLPTDIGVIPEAGAAADWRSQLASISPSQVEHSVSAAGAKVNMTEVEGRTIEQILMRSGLETFDCLFFDIEGHEAHVLSMLDYEWVKPKVIAFEHCHLGDKLQMLESHLDKRGYDVTRVSEQDSVAVRR